MPKNPVAAATAAMISVIFITSITVAADLVPSLKAWLATTFTHHWIGKGVLSVGIFVLMFLFLNISGRGSDDEALAAHVKLLNFLTLFGGFVIIAFFLWEAFLK